MTAVNAMDPQEWCAIAVDECVRRGVRHAVVCPGSRSTPFALALAHRAERGDLDVAVVVDERSAAFLALGLAKGARAPVIVLCTSGTAGAHFYPAVIEAELTQVPLLVVTADRPPMLHGFGALQSLDQTRLFGVYATFHDLGLPSSSPQALRHLRARAAQACAHRGVTHWNAPFLQARDEPTIPERRAPAGAPPRHPVIVAGPLDDAEEGACVAAWAEETRVPILAELASNLRHAPTAVAHAELLLKSGVAIPRPDLVVKVGRTCTTRALQAFVDGAEEVVCSGFFDPSCRASFAETLPVLDVHAVQDDRWLSWWQSRDALLARTVSFDRPALALDEPAVAATVVSALPVDSGLVLASSMPIRDAEAFGGRPPRGVRVVVNRGACGIDGLISTTAGLARATKRKATLLCGDLALLHDLHGLLLAREEDVVVVVVNNDGGGIFSFLPVAQEQPPERFEQIFGTPHGLTFKEAAGFCGASFFAHPTTIAELRDAMGEAHARGGLGLIEVTTERATNAAAHDRVWQQARTALEAL